MPAGGMDRRIRTHAKLRPEERLIEDDHQPLIIAEVGVNHEGEFDKAVQMVDAMTSELDSVPGKVALGDLTTGAQVSPEDFE